MTHNITNRYGKTNYLRTFSVAIIFLSCITLANAKNPEVVKDIFSLDLEELGNIIVTTATRTNQKAKDSLSSITVITRHEIERSQADTLPTLLAGIPGMHIATSGGNGSTASMYLRGTDSTNTLVLIDGIKVNSATTGLTSIQHILADQIEKIEIVRGPHSGLYGSEAIGGVIQVFTRDNRLHADKSSDGFTLGYGSRDTKKLTAYSIAQMENTSFNFHATYFDSDDISTLKNNDPDNDSYDNVSFNSKLTHTISDEEKLNFHVWRTQGRKKFDNCVAATIANCYVDHELQILSTELKLQPTKNWGLNFNWGESHVSQHNFNNAPPKSKFETKQHQVSLKNNLTYGTHSFVTVGVDYISEKVISTTNYDKNSRENIGLYSLWQGSFNKYNFLLGVRVDDNEAFGKNTTGNIAFKYTLSNDYDFKAAYGTGFKAPTFNNLYFPGFGNANLKPEKSETWSMGFNGKWTGGNWVVDLFNTKINQLITIVDTGGGIFAPMNVNKAEIDGIEFGVNLHLQTWKIGANYSYVDPRDKGTNKVLINRAKNIARINIDNTHGKWQYGLSALSESHSYDNATNSVSIDGYEILNVWSSYKLSNKWKIKAKIDNIFDKAYETTSNFNSLDRMFFLSFEASHIL